MNDQPQGPSDFITEAYSLKDKEGMIGFYDKWAQEYDEQMLGKGYESPQRIAQILDDYLLEYDIAVLDIGCGTGLTGKHIKSTGISRLDGMDISAEMVEVARSRHIYRDLFVADVNLPLEIPDNSYDAAISSGTFTHGHVGSEPLLEIFRIIKPGGLLACTIHFELWHDRGFDATFAKMIGNHEIQCLALREGPFYENAANEGWFCIYQKRPGQK